MNVTHDEHRALAFIAALLLLSAAVRLATLPEPVTLPGAGVDLDRQIAATTRAVAEEERRSSPLAPDERIDPNRADAAELDRLPGVGPRLAERIVAARAAGPFRTVPDLIRVPGIGPRTVERLAPHLSLPRAGAAGTGVEAGPGSPGAGVSTEPRIDVNVASADALARLPYVGPVLAARIVAYRDSAGPFPAVDSLVLVKGIGPATLDRLRNLVRVR